MTAPRMKIDPANVPSAWSSHLTCLGGELPARYRVGDADRSAMLRSIHNLITNDVVKIASELVREGADYQDAANAAGWLWRELADDASCRAMGLAALEQFGGAA